MQIRFATKMGAIIALAVALGLAVPIYAGEDQNKPSTNHVGCCKHQDAGAYVFPAESIGNQSAVPGYLAAKEAPEVCCKMFCYCGCDLQEAHATLLDCFTTDHGEDCTICQQEAIDALRLKKQGKTIAQIQRYIDQKYQHEYPYHKPSKALQDYQLHRLSKARVN